MWRNLWWNIDTSCQKYGAKNVLNRHMYKHWWSLMDNLAILHTSSTMLKTSFQGLCQVPKLHRSWILIVPCIWNFYVSNLWSWLHQDQGRGHHISTMWESEKRQKYAERRRPTVQVAQFSTKLRVAYFWKTTTHWGIWSWHSRKFSKLWWFSYFWVGLNLSASTTWRKFENLDKRWLKIETNQRNQWKYLFSRNSTCRFNATSLTWINVMIVCWMSLDEENIFPSFDFVSFHLRVYDFENVFIFDFIIN